MSTFTFLFSSFSYLFAPPPPPPLPPPAGILMPVCICVRRPLAHCLLILWSGWLGPCCYPPTSSLCYCSARPWELLPCTISGMWWLHYNWRASRREEGRELRPHESTRLVAFSKRHTIKPSPLSFIFYSRFFLHLEFTGVCWSLSKAGRPPGQVATSLQSHIERHNRWQEFPVHLTYMFLERPQETPGIELATFLLWGGSANLTTAPPPPPPAIKKQNKTINKI